MLKDPPPEIEDMAEHGSVVGVYLIYLATLMLFALMAGAWFEHRNHGTSVPWELYPSAPLAFVICHYLWNRYF